MNRLSTPKRIAVVSALVEGCSIRATVRMTGVAKNTISKLLLDLGAACDNYQDETLRNLPCRRIQCDEIWSFVGTKDKNIPAGQEQFGRGSVWRRCCVNRYCPTTIPSDRVVTGRWRLTSADQAPSSD